MQISLSMDSTSRHDISLLRRLSDLLADVVEEAPVQLPANSHDTHIHVPTSQPLQVSTPPTLPPNGQQPAVPAAPSSPPPVAQSPAPLASELDAAGLPWDERIHSENHAKVADGTWRKRRNVDPKLYEAVSAELRARVHPQGNGAAVAAASEPGPWPFPPPASEPEAPPAPPVMQPGMFAPAAPPALPPGYPIPPAEQAQAPAAPPLPVMQPGMFAPPYTEMTYAQLVGQITKGINEQRITVEGVNNLLGQYGIVGPAALAARPDLFHLISGQLSTVYQIAR